jgi:DNA-binding MarR family transcriptional regulator
MNMQSMLTVVSETIKVMNTLADRNDMGSQTILTFLTVAQAGDAGLPQSQLIKMTGMTQAGVSRNITRLSHGSPKNAGLHLIESYEDPMNRRHKLVKLTAAGQAILQQIPSYDNYKL